MVGFGTRSQIRQKTSDLGKLSPDKSGDKSPGSFPRYSPLTSYKRGGIIAGKERAMRYERTKSKFYVVLFNIKSLTKEVVSLLIGNGYDLNGRKIEPFSETGIVEGANGKHYIIN